MINANKMLWQSSTSIHKKSSQLTKRKTSSIWWKMPTQILNLLSLLMIKIMNAFPPKITKKAMISILIIFILDCTGGWKKSHVNTVLAELLASTASHVNDSSGPGEPSNNSSLGHYLAATSWATPRKNYPAEPSLSTEMQDKIKQNCCVEPLNIKVTYNPVIDNWYKKDSQ